MDRSKRNGLAHGAAFETGSGPHPFAEPGVSARVTLCGTVACDESTEGASSGEENAMRMLGVTGDQDLDCASIVAALAEVAVGKPWVAFDRLLVDAYALLPADVRARLVAYDLRSAARTGTLRNH